MLLRNDTTTKCQFLICDKDRTKFLYYNYFSSFFFFYEETNKQKLSESGNQCIKFWSMYETEISKT